MCSLDGNRSRGGNSTSSPSDSWELSEAAPWSRAAIGVLRLSPGPRVPATRSRMRSLLALSVLVLVAGCALAVHRQLDELYGEPDPARYEKAELALASRASSPRGGRCADRLGEGRDGVRQSMRRLPRLLRRSLSAQAVLVRRRHARRIEGEGLRAASDRRRAHASRRRCGDRRGMAPQGLSRGAERAQRPRSKAIGTRA